MQKMSGSCNLGYDIYTKGTVHDHNTFVGFVARILSILRVKSRDIVHRSTALPYNDIFKS